MWRPFQAAVRHAARSSTAHHAATPLLSPLRSRFTFALPAETFSRKFVASADTFMLMIYYYECDAISHDNWLFILRLFYAFSPVLMPALHFWILPISLLLYAFHTDAPSPSALAIRLAVKCPLASVFRHYASYRMAQRCTMYAAICLSAHLPIFFCW